MKYDYMLLHNTMLNLNWKNTVYFKLKNALNTQIYMSVALPLSM